MMLCWRRIAVVRLRQPNKRSLALDLRSKQGREIAQKLIAKSTLLRKIPPGR